MSERPWQQKENNFRKPHGHGIKLLNRSEVLPFPPSWRFSFYRLCRQGQNQWVKPYLCDSRWYCARSRMWFDWFQLSPSVRVWLDKRRLQKPLLYRPWPRLKPELGIEINRSRTSAIMHQAQHNALHQIISLCGIRGARVPVTLCTPDHFQDRYKSKIQVS